MQNLSLTQMAFEVPGRSYNNNYIYVSVFQNFWYVQLFVVPLSGRLQSNCGGVNQLLFFLLPSPQGGGHGVERLDQAVVSDEGMVRKTETGDKTDELISLLEATLQELKEES